MGCYLCLGAECCQARLASWEPVGLVLVPALRVLNYPFLALTVVLLGRGWYLQLRSHGVHAVTLWSRRSLVVLAGSTVLAAVLWGLRFGGLLGMHPF